MDLLVGQLWALCLITPWHWIIVSTQKAHIKSEKGFHSQIFCESRGDTRSRAGLIHAGRLHSQAPTSCGDTQLANKTAKSLRSIYVTGVSNIRHVYEGELPGEVSCSTESAFSRIPAPLVNCSHAGNCGILIVLMCKQLWSSAELANVGTAPVMKW